MVGGKKVHMGVEDLVFVLDPDGRILGNVQLIQVFEVDGEKQLVGVVFGVDLFPAAQVHYFGDLEQADPRLHHEVLHHFGCDGGLEFK